MSDQATKKIYIDKTEEVVVREPEDSSVENTGTVGDDRMRQIEEKLSVPNRHAGSKSPLSLVLGEQMKNFNI